MKSKISEKISIELDRANQDRTLDISLNPPIPDTMLIDICNSCNHSCEFCMSSYSTRKVSRLEEAVFQRIVAEAFELGVRKIGLYATGEPFIHTKLADFVRYTKKLGYEYVYISTNGALANQEKLLAIVDAGIDSVKFSINAGTKGSYRIVHGKDDWDTVIENVKFLSFLRASNNIDLGLYVSFIVTNRTENEKDELKSLLGEYVDEIVFVLCDNQQGQMLSNEKKLMVDASAIQSNCSLPFDRLHVSSEGYLTLCCVDYQNYLAIADLRDMSLFDAWNSELFVDMRKRHIEDNLKGTLCYNCLKNESSYIEPLVGKFATNFDFVKFHAN